MIRRIIAGILALLVLLSASATAEYEQYRLAVPDEKDAVQLWEVFPLDAHNVIVRVYSPEAPWHVDWYRDGERIRSLTTGGDYDRKTPPEPVIGEDGLLYICSAACLPMKAARKYGRRSMRRRSGKTAG